MKLPLTSFMLLGVMVTHGSLRAQEAPAPSPQPAATAPSTAASEPAAAAPATATDPDLPQPFDPAVATSLITAPPFTRSVNLSDSLVLTGIAYIEGKPVATILNKEKNESYVVSEEPNAQGWKLAETSATVQLNRTQAKIMIGAEVVTVRYAQEQLSNENRSRPGQGGDRRGDRRGDRGGDDRRGNWPRPSEETRKRFEGLSEDGRRRFFEEMRNSRERMQNLSMEERASYSSRVLENVERQERRR